MIKFSAKSTITKTLILIIVSALMLSTSTYAWFSAGEAVTVNDVITRFEGLKAASTLSVKEAIDENYDGVRNNDEEYVALQTDGILISQMQPKKMNFYKLSVLTATGKRTSVQMDEIQVFRGEDELTGTEAQTVLDNIKVTLTCTVGANISETHSLWYYIQDKTASPYTASFVQDVTNIDLYLDIGMASTVDNNVTPGVMGVALSGSIRLLTQSAE